MCPHLEEEKRKHITLCWSLAGACPQKVFDPHMIFLIYKYLFSGRLIYRRTSIFILQHMVFMQYFYTFWFLHTHRMHLVGELFQQWRLLRINYLARSIMNGSMSWCYVTPSGSHSSQLMIRLLYEHLLQWSLGKGICLMIFFSAPLVCSFWSSLLLQCFYFEYIHISQLNLF